MPERTMGSQLGAVARRLHHWAGLLVAFLQRRLLSLVLPAVLPWDASNEGRSPPCSTRPSPSPLSARLVKGGLRVLTYGEVARARRLPRAEVETCAVCLSELRRRDSVRVPRNCRHVYHRRCLDRWIDHDGQGTCPLCRAPLLGPAGSPPPPEQEQRCSWAVDQLLYLFGDDLLPASPSPSSPSPPPLPNQPSSSSSRCIH